MGPGTSEIQFHVGGVGSGCDSVASEDTDLARNA